MMLSSKARPPGHKKDKQNVKAFLLKLDFKRNGESGHAEFVIPAPSNGPHD